MKNNLKQILENSILFSKKTRIQKLLRKPSRMLTSKILQIISILFNSPIKIRAKTFWNDEMFVIVPEGVSLHIYHYGFFEEGLTKMMLEHLKPGMTFFDVGAHFGYYTLLGSSLFSDSGKVHAFEPTPSTFEILKSNTLKKSNVILNNLAVASKRKTLVINDYGIRYSAFNSVYNARLPQNIISKLSAKKYKIQAISIDEYVEENKITPDFIKIDAESFEYEILLGMKNTIDNFHPLITIEAGDMNVEGVPTCKELIEFLINKGYKPYEFKDGKSLPHALKDTYTYENLLFLPKE